MKVTCSGAASRTAPSAGSVLTRVAWAEAGDAEPSRSRTDRQASSSQAAARGARGVASCAPAPQRGGRRRPRGCRRRAPRPRRTSSGTGARTAGVAPSARHHDHGRRHLELLAAGRVLGDLGPGRLALLAALDDREHQLGARPRRAAARRRPPRRAWRRAAGASVAVGDALVGLLDDPPLGALARPARRPRRASGRRPRSSPSPRSRAGTSRRTTAVAPAAVVEAVIVTWADGRSRAERRAARQRPQPDAAARRAVRVRVMGAPGPAGDRLTQPACRTVVKDVNSAYRESDH